MSLSTPFINRPVGTTLLTIALALAGGLAYFLLPVSPLPQVDFPTIQVSAGLPGASPETMASSVATPLERQFGRIAGVTEMTSGSSLGSCNITLQFTLDRDINAAARDVQACINAARGYLPANLPSNPNYYKVNPADAPIMILSLTSDVYDKAHMYDAASSILAQKLAQVQGVGQVSVGGGALPAVRVEVNPTKLNALGLGLNDLQTVLNDANANAPKGQIVTDTRTVSLATTDQLTKADQYRTLLVAYHNGSPVRVGDVADVLDSVQDVRNSGIANGRPAVLLIINRQPGANIIQTVDRVKSLMPQFQAEIPTAMHLAVVMDRTITIRASVRDVEKTLLLSVGLVILVVFIFLRDWRSTIIPSVAVPVSLIATFGVMYLCDYSLDNLSLMALTIATGFVVDDAIVVIENVTRHLEAGMEPKEAALQGAAEIGFTVLSISISLVAVFIPLLLMGGIVGRLFREFAVTLSVAIGISMLVSLTTTPMMCAALLGAHREKKRGWLYQLSERGFDAVLRFYQRTLAVVLHHEYLTLTVTLLTVALTVYLYMIVPTGFFPQQDTGRITGNIQTDQDTSYQSLSRKLLQYAAVMAKDPDAQDVIGFCGAGSNNARMFVTLRPLGVRKDTADQVIQRLRPKLAAIPGATLYLQSVQDLRIGGHQTNAQYQYTLQGDTVNELLAWAPRVFSTLRTLPGLADVNTDQQDKGLASNVTIDRPTASRLGITPAQIDGILGDAFGQAQVSTIYEPLNQYHVVMEVAPQYWQNPQGLNYIYIKTSNGTQVPLSTFCKFATATTPLSINHDGQFPAVTISFNLNPGVSLSQAVDEIGAAEAKIGVPGSIHGSFAGTAEAYQDSLSNQPLLIAAALATVYIVLGILYESFIHPITILSTLPSAGVGALLALLLCQVDLSVIALIGIILLIGIVKKNAIMMIDFALDAERNGGMSPDQAIFTACVLRFRPIMMTTAAALLGGLPLAIGGGTGSELRQPLGIAIVGGLIFSQMLTLYTTPVVYLFLDRLRLAVMGRAHPVGVVPAAVRARGPAVGREPAALA
jgi:multidrug efflux pump